MFLPPTDDMRKPDPFETRPQRVARQRRETAARQRTRRARLAETRRPNSRQVDAALSDALALVIDTGDELTAETRVNIRDLLYITYLMLNRNGFDKEQIKDALRSRHLKRKPPDDDWLTEERAFVRRIAMKSRS